MLTRLSVAEMWGIIIDHIKKRTEVNVFAVPGNDLPSPFFGVEFISSEPRDTKTEFIDSFTFSVHAISAPTNPYSPEPVLELVRELQEIMTETLYLDAPFDLYNHSFDGIKTVKQDPSGEGHAVLDYTFDVSYGYICK